MSNPALRPWLTLAAAIGLALIIVLGFRWLGGHLPTAGSATGAALLDMGFTLALFGTLAAAGLVGILRGERLAGLLGPRGGSMAMVGAAIGAGALLVAFVYARVAGVAERVPAGATSGVLLLLLGTVATVCQAGAEELFFRGWLQRALRRDWGAAAGLLVTAAAFALLHILGGARAPLALLNILLAGILFGLLAERGGGLAAPIAAHAAYNWAETLLLGLDPNPGTGSFGAVWNYDMIGPAAWGGSGEGLNASLGLTFALVACIVPLVAAAGRPRLAPPRRRAT